MPSLSAESTSSPSAPRHRLTRPLVVAVMVLLGAAIVRAVGAVDWASVGAALGHVTVWQLGVLVVVLLLRQFLNAYPQALFLRGLGARRALLSDLGAATTAMFAPPPSDVVIRVAMSSSWGFDTSKALAATAMNTIAFYTVRFGAPILGLLLMLGYDADLRTGLVAAGSTAVAVAIVVTTSFVLRTEATARRLGLRAGHVAHRFRSSVDAERWAGACVQFRDNAQDGFGRAFRQSLLVLSGMVVVDGCMLLLALRFVGIDSSSVPGLQVLGIFLLAYPLTLTPLMGLGLLDGVLVAALVEVGGLEVEAQALAGLAVWRLLTLLGPVVMGAGVLAWWRRPR